MADVAEKLARTYLKKGERSRDWKDYLKAHGLANYCVAVDSTPERCRLVYDVEVSWYKGNHPISYKEHQQLTDAHKQLLKGYRDEIEYDFICLDDQGLLLDAEDIYSKENMTNARKFCDVLFELSRKSSNGFVSVTRNIIESSVYMLKRINQDAPCDFAVIALGSVAKGEATPYSDLEYAFITECDDKDYFEMLAMDSYFRIGNLGETPLSCFNVEELKVKEGCPPVIADLKAVGFKIDGISEISGKIPTGNDLEEGKPLTFTVDNMMKLYKTEAEAKYKKLADKSDILSSTVVIYTNEGDESQLHNRFRKERRDYERKVAQNSAAVKEKRMECFHEFVKNFKFAPKFIQFGPPRNMNIRVKMVIFRYPTLLANNIKMCMGWNLRYPWEIYTKLYSCKKMSEDTHSYIRIVLALSIYMRTRAYLHDKCETKYVSLLPQLSRSLKDMYQVPSSMFVVLGCLLIPIKRSVKSYIEKKSLNKSSAADDTSLAVAIDSVMQHIEFDKTNAMAKAEICYFAGEYKLAKKELSRNLPDVVISLETFTNSESIRQTTDSSLKHKYMELCCYILYHTKSYRAAVDFFSWFIGNAKGKGKGKIGFWKLLSAHCRNEIGDYRATRQLLDEAKQHLQQTHGSNKNSSKQSLHAADTNHEDISNSYRDIGAVYWEMGECEESIKYHELALEMDIDMFPETVHPDIASDYDGIGLANIGLSKYQLALDHLNVSLKMRKVIYRANIKHPNIAASYNNIADVYNKLADYPLSLKYHEKSIEIMKAIYGADTNHLAIAASYNNIAIVYYNLSDYKSSEKSHIKSLEMMKAIHGADTNHPDIAGSYDAIGSVYYNLGDYKSSKKFHFKSLEMMTAIYGVDTNHRDIALVFFNIGLLYNKLRCCEESLEYHKKSLEMKKAIYGADTNHPDIANGDDAIGSVYYNRGEYESSEKSHIKSLEMRKAIHGADTNHPHRAGSYNNIAKVYNERGDYSLSLEYYIKSLEMMKAIYGADTSHPDIAASYNNIAGVYGNRDDYSLSLEYYIKSLEMRKVIYGADSSHPDIVMCKQNIKQVKERSRLLALLAVINAYDNYL